MPREVELLSISGDGSQMQRRPLFRIHDAWPAGEGVLRLVEEYDIDGKIPDDSKIQLEFVSFAPSEKPPEEVSPQAYGLRYPMVAHTIELIQPEHDTARGLIIWLPGLGDSMCAKHLRDSLLDRGWAVLAVRYTNAGVGETVHVEPEEASELEETAVFIAKSIDTSSGSAPYAVEAAVQLVAADHPDWLNGPIVAVGVSAGAVGLPTLVGRTIDQLDAAVLIAGGVNLLRISQESSINTGGIRTRLESRRWSREELDALYKVYLANVTLDPYHAAPLLRQIPVLQIDGRFDWVVPAATGDLLYERLGQPERWRFFGGHGIVLLSLLFESERIADWIEAHTLGEER